MFKALGGGGSDGLERAAVLSLIMERKNPTRNMLEKKRCVRVFVHKLPRVCLEIRFQFPPKLRFPSGVESPHYSRHTDS